MRRAWEKLKIHNLESCCRKIYREIPVRRWVDNIKMCLE